MKLTADHKAILAYVARHPVQGTFGGANGYVSRSGYYGAPCADRPAIWGSLVRAGFLKTERYSEHVRGERRYYETRYCVTDAGRDIIRPTTRSKNGEAE